MILIVERQIIKNIFPLLVHPPHAVLDDDRDFVSERRIVGHHVGNGAHEQMAVAIFVLQALAVEGGAARGRAQQKTLRHDVA